MPGRSASDRPRTEGWATVGPADRLSLTVSALLIGGLVLASLALYESAQIDKPVLAPKPVVQKTAQKPLARPPTATAMSIQLPPAPAARVRRARPAAAPVNKAKPAPHRSPLKPAARRAENPRVVEPLKQTVAAKPPAPPTGRPTPKTNPVVPKPIVKEPSVPPPETIETVAAGTVVDGNQNRKFGGALLRLLEHGQGPAIEIAWPRRAAARRALYRQLTRCYGVRAAILTESAGLFVAAGEPGQPWVIDRDRFSGFIRSPQGEAIAEEEGVFTRIANHHGVVGWRPVRVFPRDVDSALLGGLGAVLGPLYKSAKQIHAAYRWDRTRLVLGDFNVDGRPLAGRVTLPLPRGRDRGPHCD